jgi:hypothetical protein
MTVKARELSVRLLEWEISGGIVPMGAEDVVEHFEVGAGFGAAAAMFKGVQAGSGFAACGFGARSVAGGFVAAAGFGLPGALFGRPGSHELI